MIECPKAHTSSIIIELSTKVMWMMPTITLNQDWPCSAGEAFGTSLLSVLVTRILFEVTMLGFASAHLHVRIYQIKSTKQQNHMLRSPKQTSCFPNALY
jgi:hypothetical protein